MVNHNSLVRFAEHPLIIEEGDITNETGRYKGNIEQNVTTTNRTTHNKNSTATPNPES